MNISFVHILLIAVRVRPLNQIGLSSRSNIIHSISALAFNWYNYKTPGFFVHVCVCVVYA